MLVPLEPVPTIASFILDAFDIWPAAVSAFNPDKGFNNVVPANAPETARKFLLDIISVLILKFFS
jgi:hypothetical protein